MKIKLTKDNWNKVRVGDKVYIDICSNCDNDEEAIVTERTMLSIGLNDCRHKVNEIRECDYYIPALRTFETLDIGDEVVDAEGNEYRILMAQGEGEYRCYLLSRDSDKKVTGSSYTAYELQKNGYTIKQPSDQEQPRELTIDEIAEKFGMKAEDVRIKKEGE